MARKQRGYVRTGGFYGRYTGLKPEKKFIDSAFPLVVIDNSQGTMIAETFNQVANGTNQSQRVGRNIIARSIEVKGSILLAAGNTALGVRENKIRLSLVWDKQTNGQVANVADMITAPDPDAFTNLSNSDRFVTLWTKLWDLNPTSSFANPNASNAITTSEMRKGFKLYKKLSLPIEFSGTSGVVGEIRSNNLLMFAVSQTNSVVAVSAHARLRYVDN